jgi:hypothetical protein
MDTVTSSTEFGCSSDPLSRIPITFGEDSISGCTLFLSYQDMSSIGCQAVRSKVNAIQTNNGVLDSINQVGMFGNSSVTKTSEWIPLIVSQFGDTVFRNLYSIPSTFI